MEAKLFTVIGKEPIHIDDIKNRVGFPIEKVTATLSIMEPKGMIRQVGGMQYVALRETSEEYKSES